MIDYTKWHPDPFLLSDAELIQDYAEFSGEDAFDIAVKVENHKEINDKEFHRLKDDFYEKSHVYIYDMLSANPSSGVRANLVNKFIPNCVQTIKNHPGRTFADFGAGLGAMCQIAHTFCEKEVTYIDLPAYSTDFASWRFKKYGWDIKKHIISPVDFDFLQQYDILFTDAVWEHLDPKRQVRYTSKMAHGLKNNGILFMLIDLAGESEDMPFHYNVDIHQIHDILLKEGLTCQYGLYNFASQWRKL